MRKNPCWLIALAAAVVAALHAAPPPTPGEGRGSASCGAEMKDTTFYPNEAQTARLATSYNHTADGGLAPVKNRIFVMMIQRANIGNGDASEIRRAFQETAAQP